MKVLVTDPIAEAGIERLREQGHEIEKSYNLSQE